MAHQLSNKQNFVVVFFIFYFPLAGYFIVVDMKSLSRYVNNVLYMQKKITQKLPIRRRDNSSQNKDEFQTISFMPQRRRRESLSSLRVRRVFDYSELNYYLSSHLGDFSSRNFNIHTL